MSCSAAVNCGRRRAVPNEERRLKREGFLNYARKSTGVAGYVGCELLYLVFQHGIERLDDTCRVPPFRRLDGISDSGHLSASFCLYFAYRAEPTCGESFFELAVIEVTTLDTGREITTEDIRGDAVVWVIVRLKSGEQAQPILLSQLLGGDNAGRW